MYLVIGPRGKGYWISKLDSKKDLLDALDNGHYKNYWVSQGPDLEFVDKLPKILEECSTMNEFNPNQVMIVKCEVVIPEPIQVTTKYKLED